MKRHTVNSKHPRSSLNSIKFPPKKIHHILRNPKTSVNNRHSVDFSASPSQHPPPDRELNPICEMDSAVCGSVSNHEIQPKSTQCRSKFRSLSFTTQKSSRASQSICRLSQSDTSLYHHNDIEKLKISKLPKLSRSISLKSKIPLENSVVVVHTKQRSSFKKQPTTPPSSKKKKHLIFEHKRSSETITSDMTYSNNCIKSSSQSQERPVVPVVATEPTLLNDQIHILRDSLRKTLSSPPSPVVFVKVNSTKVLTTSVSAPVTSTSKKIHRLPRRHQRDIRIMRDKRAARSLFILVVVFLIFLFPYVIVAVASTAGFRIPSLVFEIAFWLLWLNSAFNPFLYPFIQVKYRKAYVKLFSYIRTQVSMICTCWNKHRYQHQIKKSFI
ncbi:unnamed protein product [Didymodactylos carnosus]|uniref:G-protein coupled receptors family 1 profile domain-containing protein n=1 Tax=Didymodactylos carnosus TaxID=1234261 RepID=A0A8S2EBA7_9BILA|nr:unnamed protein product [Didymodactylos carnosus]CAF3989821.1 unnamed protein product [Didymodactylos carnosus]